METGTNKPNGLTLQIAFAAAPSVHFLKQTGTASTGGADDFSVNLQFLVSYQSLNGLIQGYMGGKRFELSEGLINSHVVVQQVRVAAAGQGNMHIQVHFGGSFRGNADFTGKPVLDAPSRTLRIENLNYEMETGNFLLRVAQSLLQSRIRNELLKRTVFPLQPYLNQAQAGLEQMIFREWTKGVGGKGNIRSIELLSLAVLPQGLQVSARCTGNLTVRVEVQP